jgi:hypothetical protein
VNVETVVKGARLSTRVACLALPACILACGIESLAYAAPGKRVPVRLSYTREAGADSCPEESVFRDSVLSRLGYDPFEESAPRALTVVVRRTGDTLVARIELRDAAGHLQGERVLNGTGTDCSELGNAMAIAVSLGIDPLSAAALPVATPPNNDAAGVVPIEPPQPPPVPVARDASPPASPSPTRGAPIELRISVGASLTWGVTPATPAAGPVVDVGIRRGVGSLSVEGAASFAPTDTQGDVGVKASLELVSLVPCLHLGVGAFCLIGGVGSLNATGVVRSPQSDHSLFADVGVRVGVEIPFAKRFYVGAHVDGLVNLTKVAYDVGAQDTWNTAPVSGSFGVAVGVVP